MKARATPGPAHEGKYEKIDNESRRQAQEWCYRGRGPPLEDFAVTSIILLPRSDPDDRMSTAEASPSLDEEHPIFPPAW